MPHALPQLVEAADSEYNDATDVFARGNQKKKCVKYVKSYLLFYRKNHLLSMQKPEKNKESVSDGMRKRVWAAVCAAAMLAGMVPVNAFAEGEDENYSMTLVADLKDADGDGYIEPGETVELTVSFEGMGWAKAGVQELRTAKFYMGFDKSVMQMAGSPDPDTGYATFTSWINPDLNNGYVLQDNSPDYANEQGSLNFLLRNKSQYSPVFEISDDKTAIGTWTFVGVSEMPAVEAEATIQFSEASFEFSPTFETPVDEHLILYPSGSCATPLKVDGKGPTVQLEGSDSTTFYYQPIAVTVSDEGSGVASVTLNGEAVTDSITTGGTLVATDNRGNQTTLEVTVDAAAYNAAITAAQALPATVMYGDQALIQQARAALDAVTDPTALEHLADVKAAVEAAEAAWQAIDSDKTAAETLIAGLPALDDLTLQDVSSLNEIETLLAGLQDKGVTTDAVAGYESYLAACDKLEGVRAEINAVKEQIDALPAAADVAYGDAQTIAQAAQALEALKAKYPSDAEAIDAAVDLDRLTAAQEALANLDTQRNELVQKIAGTTYKITLFKEDTAVIEDLRAEVTAMQDKGATFTAEELKALTDAEAALEALTKQSEEAHAAVAALPAAENVLYTDKAAIQAVADQVAALEGKDTFTQEETDALAAAQQAIQAIETSIADLDARIAGLNVDESTVTKADVQAVQEMDKDLQALYAKGVETSDLTNYNRYTQAVAAVQKWLDAIDAFTEAVNSLPDADAIGFNDGTALTAAEKMLEDLADMDLQDLTDEAVRNRLQTLRQALTDLQNRRDTLVAQLAQTKPAVTLKAEDLKTIQDLRTEADALQAKGAALTEQELKNLVEAESELSALQTRSQVLHKQLAALPGREEIGYQAASHLDSLQEEWTALEALGDTFTQEEQTKLSDAQAGIQDIRDMVEDLALRMMELKDPTEEETPVLYSDKVIIDEMRATIKKLADRGCNAMEVITQMGEEDYETYGNAFGRYMILQTAVGSMEEQIAASNQKMTDALADWTYGGDTKPYEEIRAEMDALQERYQIPQEAMETLFPDYDTNNKRDTAVKNNLNAILEKVQALPGTVTLDNQKDVEGITSLLESLKRTYGLTDEMLAQQLGSAYTTYQNAVNRIEELLKEEPVGEEKPQEEQPNPGTQSSQNNQNNENNQNNQSAQSEQTAQASQSQSAAPAATAAQPAPVIPQTGDPLPLALLAALCALSVLGLGACVIIRRKRQH